MAVLPWGHSRNRTTSNEKRQNPALEWFSRSGGAEPSRQALSLLIKEHTRSKSAGSASLQSRSSTAQSHHSKQSHSSQATDDNEKSLEQRTTDQSRPSTPQLPMIRPTSPTYSLASALDLFGISGGLKRKGSKMSINSEMAAASSTVVSPSRTGHSRLGFRKKDSPVSPTRSETNPPSISQPFAFQHITHSEQGHFNGLSKIDESELVSQFGAVQASQNPDVTLRGIQADELPQSPHGRPCSPLPEPQGGAELPMTPPRPAPPPKDSPRVGKQQRQLPSLEVRMSRSMENFSRPTPRSPASPVNASPKHIQPSTLPFLAEAEEPVTSPFGKPLPHPPAVIHVLSTRDDTAQCMKSAPLPSPPLESQTSNLARQRQPSSRGLLRHMSTFPSPRQHMRHSAVIPESHYATLGEEKTLLPRNKSEDALTRYTDCFSSQMSSLPKKEDWEDAIEYAWDHADDQSIDDDSSDSTSTAACPDDHAAMMPASQRPVSKPSTPLMNNFAQSQEQPYNDNLAHSSSADHMVGLGIDSTFEPTPALEQTQPPTLGITIPDHQEAYGYHLPKTTYSAISKSSSQESIILSIASSILGTQRSSNSSVSPSELSRLSKCDEPISAVTSTSSPLLTVDNQKAARPESTCVPVSLLKGFSVPDSDVASDSAKKQAESEVEDGVAPLPSETSVEEKLTAVSTPTSPLRSLGLTNKSPRKRSNTQTSLPRRNGRASYSLFPSAPMPPTTS